VLGTLPMIDLSVEDPPLEEVMRDLFAGAAAKSLAGESTEDAA